MTFTIYDSITREVACLFDTDDMEFYPYGRFAIKEYSDGTQPVVSIYSDGTTLLEDDSIMLLPEYFEEENNDI